jgi:uncharacterized protein (DUF2235 family)
MAADSWAIKRIILCCDGTGCNSHSRVRFTNVSRIMRLIKSATDVGTAQLVLYIPGVGSDETNSQNLWNKGYGIGLFQHAVPEQCKVFG